MFTNRSREGEKTGAAAPASGSPPAISLPKGGGAIRGIGEKFAANPVTGTGSMTVPIATSPGRSGFGPQLALAYDSGAGNGPFGFGWDLSLPAITRKTDKGLPQYRDAAESDLFILSGAEDLVPALDAENGWIRLTFDEPDHAPGYRIDRYRPRVEGLFARIERWTRKSDGDTHWRSITRDNITTLYGKDNNSRIFDPTDPDPEHPKRIFSWLICESYDDKGNAIVYGYREENSDSVDLSQAHEKNRTTTSRAANRYLKRIKYGNRISRLVQPDVPQAEWMFEVVFDYGEHDPDDPQPHDAGEWLCRHDPFSVYRAGFEVRTYRLCQRVLTFHHFPDEAGVGKDCLVRSTDFIYRNIRNDPDDLKQGHPVASFIASITQHGYKRQAGGYLKKPLPPLEFAYSQADIAEEVREVDAESLENQPIGLDGTTYQWVDLDGEGVSGILTEQAEGWFYKRNLSPITLRRDNGTETAMARFAPIESLAQRPSLADVRAGQQQFLDLAGDGQIDLVQFSPPLSGYYERTQDGNWAQFVPFQAAPTIAWDDPNLKFVDLTGNGHADILISEDAVFTWYPSLAEAGFGPAERVRQTLDEEKGPRLVFADGTQSVYLADISGDGLTDLVRVRNGEVCYWPNLGYGRFGTKVTMDNAPRFDAPDLFDQRRIRLADIDGSGVTDIIYLGRDGARLYFNQSGNSWSEARRLNQFPHIDNLSSVTVVDLLGNGTACLVWSSPLPGEARRPMRYIDLMGGQKPHLLISVKNNLGAETYVHYAPSTRFYLADKAAGHPWITRLPFPVHVVERVETCDRISGNRFVTRYVYHHGYFDGVEREFRGFGMVEQQDTEAIGVLQAASDSECLSATNLDESSYVPPVLTKTWFHTGAFLDGSRISRQFESEYYRESDASEGLPGLTDEQAWSMLLDDTTLPADLSLEEAREAVRALKGSVLRQEIYALDNTEEADRPYSVSERNYTLKRLQPRGDNRHAVFFIHACETIDFHYERKLVDIDGTQRADPRISHAMTLAVDDFGNVLQSVAIGYGRRRVDPDPLLGDDDREKQRRCLVTYTENRYTDPVDRPNDYRAPLPCETRTYELFNVTPAARLPGVTNLFRFDELAGKIAAAGDGQHDLPYEDVRGSGAGAETTTAGSTNGTTRTHEDARGSGAGAEQPYRRLIEQLRTLYRKDDLTGPLALSQLDPLALPYESYKLAFTPSLARQVYVDSGKLTVTALDSVLADEGGYVQIEGNWWIPSGQVFYSPTANDPALQELVYARQHFFLPHRFRDPFGHTTTVRYDTYDLLLLETEDPLHNKITVGERDSHANIANRNDYRVLQPALITDPNGNRAEVVFDALGMVVGTAVMGKPEEDLGDSLDNFRADLEQSEIDAFFDSDDPHVLAAGLLGQATTRIVYDVTRFQREGDRLKPTYAATLARETHVSNLSPGETTKTQLSFSYSDGFGREIQQKIQAEPGPVVEGGPDVAPRWVGSGWTIFNNKGKPVRQYEPFFDDTHDFRFGRQVGVSPILFYDPVERVVATLHPNHTYEKVVFDPWHQETWDVNDTLHPALRHDPRVPDILPDHAFDPADDPDVGHYFQRLSQGDYRPTWYDLRMDAAKALQAWPDHDPVTGAPLPEHAGIRAAETQAARQSAVHASTPSIAYLDSLGRVFLTVADNGLNDQGTAQRYPTRVELDIEGNQRAVIDARERIVMQYDYDLLGNRVRQVSMDAGARWTLNDVAGNPIRRWDSRGHAFRTEYDELRRPVRAFVTGADPSDPAKETLFERTVYGEAHPDSNTSGRLNLRGKVFMQLDGAGAIVNVSRNTATGEDEGYDFKGNLLRSTRRLARDYKQRVDWSAVEPLLSATPLDLPAVEAALSPLLEADSFTTSTTFDALDRPATMTTPDNSVVRPTYNEANLLERVEANLRGAATATPFVDDIDYNAKGQRVRIEYGNAVVTQYTYDADTFRLIQLTTTRPAFPADEQVVQDLRYTYDPAGNITHIQDNADIQNVIFFRNRRVEPSNDYTYDALYRLVEAHGREHLGQTDGRPNPPTPPDAFNHFHIRLDHPGNGEAMGTYVERYRYDEVGNIEEMKHHGSDPAHPGWTRSYAYDEPSLIEPGKTNNRLSSTTVDGITERYEHDEQHGLMTRMPHLDVMEWDFEDQLSMTQQQVVNGGPGERTYYVYNAAGQRVRKVTERQNGTRKAERIYLGGFETYREYNGNGDTVTLERETLHIMDGTEKEAETPDSTDNVAQQKEVNPQRLALVETRTQGDDGSLAQLVRYQFGNHLGSASLELDENAQIISYEEYYPYGSTAYQAVRRDREVGPKRYRYIGKERDEETDLYYCEARYYVPWLGRWTRYDPINDHHGKNPYAYGQNNPIIFVDPDGNQDKTAVKLYDLLQSVANQLHIRRNPREGAQAFGTRLHSILQNIVQAGTFNFPHITGQRRLVTELILSPEGRIVAFGGSPGELGKAAKGYITADAGVLKSGVTRGPNLIGRDAKDVLAAAIDYKTGAKGLEPKQVAFFEKLRIPLAKLTPEGNLAAAVAKAEQSLSKLSSSTILRAVRKLKAGVFSLIIGTVILNTSKARADEIAADFAVGVIGGVSNTIVSESQERRMLKEAKALQKVANQLVNQELGISPADRNPPRAPTTGQSGLLNDAPDIPEDRFRREPLGVIR